jgi:hypothetical protein
MIADLGHFSKKGKRLFRLFLSINTGVVVILIHDTVSTFCNKQILLYSSFSST